MPLPCLSTAQAASEDPWPGTQAVAPLPAPRQIDAADLAELARHLQTTALPVSSHAQVLLMSSRLKPALTFRDPQPWGS